MFLQLMANFLDNFGPVAPQEIGDNWNQSEVLLFLIRDNEGAVRKGA